MKIAIIGSGIAGNVAAYRLRKEHEITVFEAGDHVGGHTNTIDIDEDGRRVPVDTGFIVYNDRTYPNFVRLLDEIGQPSQPSEMSFSVRSDRTGLEYCGSSLDGLFAQRRNLLRPSFYRMLRDILRFNTEAPAALSGRERGATLGDYLEQNGYSTEFRDDYLVPMVAAIWSAEPVAVREMPLAFLVRFFINHGLLQLVDRPQWRVIRGGSREYVDKLVAGHRERIRLGSPVESVRRFAGHVEVKPRGGPAEAFDHVFVACHSDQALGLLADPTPAEREVLGAIPYQSNEAILHTDTSLLPRRRRAWAAWNYHVPADPQRAVSVTYNMNVLQSLETSRTYCVTLNSRERIDPRRILRTIRYHHPVFKSESIAAQARQSELNSGNRTFYCGAYWRNGFHEDGVVSALDALRHFEGQQRRGKLHLRRAS